MKILIIFTLLTIEIFASNLLTYNIYERTDRVDIMLSFDSPYEGKIYQKRENNKIILTLEDLAFDKTIKKNLNSIIVKSLEIIPDKNSLKVILKTDNQIGVIASKTTDGFGLRIRSKLILMKKQNNYVKKQSAIKQNSNLDLIDQRYIFVVLFLFALLIIMFWIKKRVDTKTVSNSKGSWLFKNQNNSQNIDIKIIHKKPIDNNNSLLLVEFENRRYLLMSGSSNVLIDTFTKDDIKNDSEFQKVFEENRKKLDDFLKIQERKVNSYKERAQI